MVPSRGKAIEEFVRHTLGCRCPDEVFRSIQTSPGPVLEGIMVRERIVIGGRLLIYIISASDIEGTDRNDAYRALIHAGLRERDTSGLNRFRLVIGVDDPDQCSQKAEDLLRDTGIYDERLHIHIVGKDELDLLQI